MIEDLIVIGIYTVVVLFFVPLKTIGKYQDKVRNKITHWKDKI